MVEENDSNDWRSKCKSASEMQAVARKKSLFIDVHFLIGPRKSARNFSAHKAILACGSPVFEAMFFGQLPETKDPVTIPDDDPEAFEVMLRYLYGESVSFSSVITACKTYTIGDKYFIRQLQIQSANYISAAEIDDKTFWGIIKGNLFSNKHAKRKFQSYIQHNATRLLNSDEFLDVPEYIVKIILQMNELYITEFEILSSVTKWGLKNFTNGTVERLRTLLQYIRFSTITPKEFCLFTENFPDAMEPVTSLKILKHLNDVSNYKLPEWCSTNKAWRVETFMMSRNQEPLFSSFQGEFSIGNAGFGSDY